MEVGELNELENKSPLPQQEQKTLTFTQALEEVILGKKITKLEWNNKNIYCLLKDTFLEIYINNEFKAWTISDGDMIGSDWVVLEESN